MKTPANLGFDLLPLPSGGRLLLSPNPTSLPGLTTAQALGVYQTYGARILVSLVTEFELFKLDLTDLSDACGQLGLQWLHAPILDHHAPDTAFESWWEENHTGLFATLSDGHTLALHCWGGLGRTGTVAARILMVRENMNALTAINTVRQTRPGSVETPAQNDYLWAFNP